MIVFTSSCQDALLDVPNNDDVKSSIERAEQQQQQLEEKRREAEPRRVDAAQPTKKPSFTLFSKNQTGRETANLIERKRENKNHLS